MDNQKQALIQKLREANNVLVTVSANPTVDQLAACIGLTLLLNKLKKHASAVFSGQVPSTLEFLKPEETLEKTTDSLRDFIVSLDKSKADKLRYKVEDNVVKIFITPYRTSISEADLVFSQGDFNIDVVLCLGVEKQQDLDQAIVAHGRILHDATVAAVSITSAGDLGTLNWVEPRASSLSELAAQIGDALGREQIDGQIATAFLTGIVAETNRFSNEKTSPVTMQLSAQLMSAGANQQLVATELQGAVTSLAINGPAPDASAPPSNDGTLEIGHSPEPEGEDTDNDQPLPPVNQPPQDEPDSGSDGLPVKDIFEQMDEVQDSGLPPHEEPPHITPPTSRMILQPPTMNVDGELPVTSSESEDQDEYDAPSMDPVSMLDLDRSPLHHGTHVEVQPPEEQPAPTMPVDEIPEAQIAGAEAPASDAPGNVVLPEVQSPASEPVPEPVVEPASEPALATPPAEPTVIPPAPEAEASVDKPLDFEPLPSEPAITVDQPVPAGVSPVTSEPAPEPEPEIIAPAAASPVATAGEQSLADLEKAVDSPHLQTVAAPAEPAPAPTEIVDTQSLADLEKAVDSPHLQAAEAPEAPVEQSPLPAITDVKTGGDSLEAARDAVIAAASDGPQNALPEPMQASGSEGYLNVQDIPDTTLEDELPSGLPASSPGQPNLTIPAADPTPPTSVTTDPSTAPPVPPPLPLDDMTKFTAPK